LSETSLHQAQQENLLTLLVYDITALPVLSQNLEIDLLESYLYRNIAQKALSFYEEFKKPIAEHLPDSLSKELSDGGKDGKAELYTDIINCLHNNRDSVNKDYVLKELSGFVRIQQLKLGIIKAAELLDDNKADEAESVLEDCKQKQLNVFDPGTFLHEHKKVFDFLYLSDEFIPTGIKQLDDFGVCPAPKELMTLAGLSGRGKTWWFIHLSRYGLLQRKKVLIVSLEMGVMRLFQRYFQNMFAYSKREEEYTVPYFETDEMGRLYNVEFDTVTPEGTFQNPKKARRELTKHLSELRNQNLLIKEFPAGSLTVPAFKAYLENLINYTKFHPDMILIDSPDDMKHDVRYKTESLEQTYREIRGMATDYNTAMCVVSHINRGGRNAPWLDEEYLTGAFAKMFISDNLITFNQTDAEYEYNLARLLVVKGRNDRKGMKILMSQNYAMGQFCLDSVMMSDKYKEIIKSLEGDEGNEGR